VLPDPTPLYRIRDGVYAPDLLIAAVVEFDLFSWLAGTARCLPPTSEPGWASSSGPRTSC
jgi:hypothetical protein